MIPAYIDALLSELRAQKDIRAFQTVYIGGGTPSLLPENTVGRLMDEILSLYDIEGAQITIEANPVSLTREKLEEYIGCGVNRVSLGVQSLSDDLLITLGRAHDAAKARETMRLLNEYGVNWSADVMLSLPKQRFSDVKATLDGVFAFNPPHISAYSLILERGTRLFEAVSDGMLELPDEDYAYEMENLAVRLLEKSGYTRYEVSSFAKPGFESLHNLNYWNNGAYAGIGLAAHGAYRGKSGEWVRTKNSQDLLEYIRGEGRSETKIPLEGEMFETVMLALRKTEGLSLGAFAVRFRERFETRYARQIDECEAKGLLKIHKGFAMLTHRGMEIQNRVLEMFL